MEYEYETRTLQFYDHVARPDFLTMKMAYIETKKLQDIIYACPRQRLSMSLSMIFQIYCGTQLQF